MDDSIATASKNLLKIKKRDLSHKVFRGIQILVGDRTENANSLLLYPEIRSPDVFADLINRFGWYLPEDTYEDCTIHVIGDSYILTGENTVCPSKQAEFSTNHLPIVFHDPSTEKLIADEVDRILVWNKHKRFDRVTIPRLRKIEVIDPEYFSTIEPGTWSRVSNQIRRTTEDSSRENFEALEQDVGDETPAYVFATGPSLDDVFDIEIPPSALSIICNSIVRNEKLLEHIQPDILVFADPVFHFGPSKYAHEFRKDAVAALEQYDCTAVIPNEYHNLLAGHYPRLRDQIIGLEGIGDGEPIYPTHDRLEVMGTDNIMTLYMLPIAMSLTDDVRIMGADGRKDDESYFWEHSDTAQYDDQLMKTVADTHPSFFRDRIYEDYYDQHVETLTEVIEYGEAHGVRVRNLTNSYMPCLAERRVDPDEMTTSPESTS